MLSVPQLLAQAASTDKSSRLFGQVLPWLLVLLGVIVVGGVIILLARRYLHNGGASEGGGFTLHDLRQMHAGGEISDDEFERAKAQMIGRLKSNAAPASTNSEGDDAASTGNHGEPQH